MSKKKVDDLLLPPNTVRNLNDKLYEKRKLGALEIEQLVKDLVKSKVVNFQLIFLSVWKIHFSFCRIWEKWHKLFNLLKNNLLLQPQWMLEKEVW